MHVGFKRSWPALVLCAALSGGVEASAQSSTTRKPASSKPSTTQTTARPTQTRSSLAKARAAAAERARRAAAARARERARIEQEAMTPRYKRDVLGNQIPEVRAASAIVFDP